uniref:Uncharacterized protein n=1 Tax=Glossina palpalis gambiensis TaxID=67801 RepID=A0A1B0C789_9MUSC
MRRIQRGRELAADLLSSGSFSSPLVDQSRDKIKKSLIANILRGMAKSCSGSLSTASADGQSSWGGLGLFITF